MTKFQQHLPRKVEFARDAIVSLIHDRGLGKGDRLPSYSRMRGDFGIGSQTIAAAVEFLCDLGVLEVQDKVGIFVKNPDGGQLAGRTVAVAVRQLVGSSYAAMLASFIQKLLNEHNCHCLTFYQTSSHSSRRPDMNEFPGLEQAVRENNIDGIITLCPFSDRTLARLDECGIKSCFIGDDDHNVMPCGVLIDVKHFISMAQEELRNAGCRKIIQLFATPEQKERRSDLLEGVTGSSYSGGAAIAAKFLALPPSERPDGIISDDDTIVSGFLAELGQRGGSDFYSPKIATIVHDEVGELYPSANMLLYSQNMEQYSQMAVELLLQLVQNIKVNDPVKYYRFKKIPTERVKK